MSVFVPNARLNGRRYDYRNDENLNELQMQHLRGELDLYALLPQVDGEPLPPVALQWKRDYTRRF